MAKQSNWQYRFNALLCLGPATPKDFATRLVQALLTDASSRVRGKAAEQALARLTGADGRHEKRGGDAGRDAEAHDGVAELAHRMSDDDVGSAAHRVEAGVLRVPLAAGIRTDGRTWRVFRYILAGGISIDDRRTEEHDSRCAAAPCRLEHMAKP